MLVLVCNNYHCQCMSDKDQGSKVRMHSISDGLIVIHFFVSMEFIFVHTVKYTFVISLAFAG